MIVRYLYSIAIWTAALAAATAGARLIAFLSGADPLSQSLIAMGAAAAIGALSLLLSALVLYLLARRQPRLTRALAGANPPAGDCAACLHKRREVPQTKALPMVHRNGMDSCPFRFASPHAHRASAAGVALDSFESGTATR